jgi:hypothetical protein
MDFSVKSIKRDYNQVQKDKATKKEHAVALKKNLTT